MLSEVAVHVLLYEKIFPNLMSHATALKLVEQNIGLTWLELVLRDSLHTAEEKKTQVLKYAIIGDLGEC